MKRIILMLLILISILSFADKFADVKKIKENYIAYYYGEGVADNPSEASKYALNDLISQISVNISSDFTSKINDENEKSVELIVKSQTKASLKNINTISYENNNGDFFIFKYMKKSEIGEIFTQRKELIYSLFIQSEEAVEAGDIRTALKLLYFSNILLNSLPEEKVEYAGITFSTVIPYLLNDIIMNTKFYFVDSQVKLNNTTKEVVLKAMYNDIPVESIDYMYWDGHSDQNFRLRNGISVITLLGGDINKNKLRIRLKYNYEEEKNQISAVSDLWDIVKKAKYDNKKSISLLKKAKLDNNNSKWKTDNTEELSIKKQDKIKTGIENFIKSLKTQSFNYKNTKLQNKLASLLKYTHLEDVSMQESGRITKTYEGYEYRPIYVKTYYNTINTEAVEVLVLDFDKEGNLKDVNYSTKKDIYNAFVEKSKHTDDWEKRQVIVKFLEKYRTAFLTRDLKVLDEIFSEDAIIIVGNIRKADNSGNYEFKEEDKIEYNKYTKTQYLNNVKRMFRNRDDIFLDFYGLRLDKKNHMDGVYGLSMRQSFNSTTYSDEGYLFLLVDFNNDKPQIHVRSWQPKEWNDEKLNTLASFKVYK